MTQHYNCIQAMFFSKKRSSIMLDHFYYQQIGISLRLSNLLFEEIILRIQGFKKLSNKHVLILQYFKIKGLVLHLSTQNYEASQTTNLKVSLIK